jgi:alpha-methylacyl-CoA racemase
MSPEYAGGGPLAGVRVVELGAIGPAPYACMLLSDLGAIVTRVDRTEADLFSGAGDPRYDFLLRGRERIALDVKSDAGRAILLELVTDAEIFIEGLRPGVAERLGIGPEECFQRNSRLVYGRMTGWGQTGPLARTAGHDINYIALSGALHAIGAVGGPPTVPLNLIGDFGGGAAFLVMGVLAALLESRKSGRGQVVDAAMLDGATSLMSAVFAAFASGYWRDQRGRNLLDGGAPFYAVYETADKKHIAVGAIEPKFFAQLLEKMGLDPSLAVWQFDASRWDEMRELFIQVFCTRSRDAWCQHFGDIDACVSPVLSLAEVVEHEHVRARGVFESVHGVAQPAPAPRFSRTPTRIARGGVSSGFDTRAILERLGYTSAEIEALRASAIVGGE